MKKVLCIELSYTWVLTRIDDSKYPIETIKEKLLRGNKYNVVSESYVHLTLETNESDIEKIKARVTSIFTQKYGKENLDALSFPIGINLPTTSRRIYPKMKMLT